MTESHAAVRSRGSRSPWRAFALACAWAALASSPVLGQGPGVIQGHVTDAGGGALSGANVTAKDATGAAVSKLTDADGAYSIHSLAPGTYQVTAEACAAVTKDVVVHTGAVVTVDFELACGSSEPKASMDIYGFAMLDMGYQGGQNDPDWFDVLRPTKLPKFTDQFGKDGHFFAGVRQSRLGVKANIPTDVGEIKTTFEFELFGTGTDAGQTTFRLRHAYGELGHFGAGQTWSPFMDIDVFPNSIEYWGPNGMVFFRNVQVRWMPIQGDSRLTFALERPGASADGGDYADRIEVQNLKGRFPYPDLSGEWRHAGDWGYVEVAGIVRYMRWDDTLDDQFDLSGSDIGWGINLSSNIKIGDHVARLQGVYGEGIQNYMNDAPVDIGPRVDPGNLTRPLKGEVLPMFGLVAFMDFNWSDHATSSIGYSFLEIDNSNGQSADAFSKGDYALANILFYPTKGVMFGPELQYGRRKNFRDGFSSDDLRVQFSVRYNFSHHLGGN